MSEAYDLPGVEAAGPADAFPHVPGTAEHAADPDPADAAATVAGTDRAPEPLGVIVEATGNADVDAAVERLSDADALPTDAHVEVYEDVHRGLRDTLTALDENRG